MTHLIEVIKVNESYMLVDAPSGVKDELHDFFSFYMDGYKFSPAYKHHLWDGKVRLYNRQNKQLFVGLLPYVQSFAEEREYILNVDSSLTEKTKVSFDEVSEFLKQLKLDLTPRDYQINAVRHALENKRSLILSPTSSGKSLIIYSILRYLQEYMNDFNALLVVPTVGLVEQMSSDFLDYSKNDNTFDESNIHKIYQGQSKNTKKTITISTWQSLQNLPKEFFSQYTVIIGDEAHLCKAKSLTKIISACSNAPYRIGTTGTLDNKKVHRLALEGMFGSVFQTITTEKLISRGDAAFLKINCILLQYSDTERNQNKKLTWREEVTWLLANERRNALISKMAVKTTGNTLVMIEYIAHGKHLFKEIQSMVPKSRKVYYIAGETTPEVREKTRFLVEREKDAIIVASVKVFSHGVNIQNLDNIIFTTPTKSRIRTLQSIGRSLRIGRNKEATLYDVVDDMCWKKSHKNYAFQHFMERLNMYIEEKHPYKLFKINL